MNAIENTPNFDQDSLNSGNKDFANKAKNLKNKVTQNMAHLGEEAAEYYDRGLQQVKGLEKTFEQQIRANPVRSLLIVAGIGWALGSLRKRR